MEIIQCKCGGVKRKDYKQCRKCYLDYYKNRTHKNCKGCNRRLTLDKFRSRLNENRPRSRCRECESNYAKQFRKQHPDKVKERKKRYAKKHPEMVRKWHNHRRWRKLGFDIDMVETYISAHNNFCEICGTKTELHSLAVDHNHKTGMFRGLLCSKCNCGLGMFQDNPQLLIKANQYLQTKSLATFGTQAT